MKSQEARGEIIEQGKKPDGTPYLIGVIDLPSFYADFGGDRQRQELHRGRPQILKEFEAKKVDGVVLDLRRNGGGSLGEALALDAGYSSMKDRSCWSRDRRGQTATGRSGKGIGLRRAAGRAGQPIQRERIGNPGGRLAGLRPGPDRRRHGHARQGNGPEDHRSGRSGREAKLGALKLTIQQFYRLNGDSTQSRGRVSPIIVDSFAVGTHAATSEKDIDFALAFDKVKAAEHAESRTWCPADVKNTLKDLIREADQGIEGIRQAGKGDRTSSRRGRPANRCH